MVDAVFMPTDLVFADYSHWEDIMRKKVLNISSRLMNVRRKIVPKSR
jgi:hypothetical protein